MERKITLSGIEERKIKELIEAYNDEDISSIEVEEKLAGVIEPLTRLIGMEKATDRFTIGFLIEGEDSVNLGHVVDAEVVYEEDWININVDDQNEDQEWLSFCMNCENVDADTIGSTLSKLKKKYKVFTWEEIEDDLGFYHNAAGA